MLPWKGARSPPSAKTRRWELPMPPASAVRSLTGDSSPPFSSECRLQKGSRLTSARSRRPACARTNQLFRGGARSSWPVLGANSSSPFLTAAGRIPFGRRAHRRSPATRRSGPCCPAKRSGGVRSSGSSAGEKALPPSTLTIDLEGFERRAVQLPVPNGFYGNRVSKPEPYRQRRQRMEGGSLCIASSTLVVFSRSEI
jgi:hypothetical protein